MATFFGRGMYRARWIALILTLAIVGFSAFYGTSVFGLLKSGGFDDPGSESTRAQNLLDQKLGGASADVVILMSSDTLHVTDQAFAEAATSLLDRLQKRPEVASITSYYTTHSPSLISRDGHETFATLQLVAKEQSAQEKDFLAIKPLITSPGLHILIGGTIPTYLAINTQVGIDIETAEIVTYPVVTILLFFVFDSIVAALLPLLMGGIAILGAFAVLRVIVNFTDVSIFAINIITMLSMGLAIDYALFIVTRFREEMARLNNDTQKALQRTMATAGRTVLFSGLTVSMCLASLLLFPQIFLRSMGAGAIGSILVVLIAAMTFLPAALAILGKRINALSILRRFRAKKTARTRETQGAWYRFSEAVMRWPLPIIAGVLLILGFLGYPFLHVTFTVPDARVLPAEQTVRVVSDHLTKNFAQQGNAQLVIAVQMTGDVLQADNLQRLSDYISRVETLSGVQHVDSLVSVNPSITLAQYQQIYAHLDTNPQFALVARQYANGNATKVVVAVQPEDNSAAAEELVRQIRALPKPAGMSALVYGVTPVRMDMLSSIGRVLPYAFGLIGIVIFVLLFLMTCSLLVPLKAIILNVFSLTATFGGLVWIFQDGHLQNILKFNPVGGIDATQLVLVFAVAFGLSMDYEVFLLSRIKEQYDLTGDNRAAVSRGVQKTGWLITSAAILLAIVFLAFSGARIIFIQEVGIGLAIAVIMDATLIRMLLVPATMRLLGTWNWWAPQPLRTLWRLVGLSESETPSTDDVISSPVEQGEQRSGREQKGEAEPVLS